MRKYVKRSKGGFVYSERMKVCKHCIRYFVPAESFREKDFCNSKCEYDYKKHRDDLKEFLDLIDGNSE